MKQQAASLQPIDSFDSDLRETSEWLDALMSLLDQSGPERTRQILDVIDSMARDPKIGWQPARGTPYVNTIPVDRQPAFPGDLAMEERLASLVRWNALAMVARWPAGRRRPPFPTARPTIRHLQVSWPSSSTKACAR